MILNKLVCKPLVLPVIAVGILSANAVAQPVISQQPVNATVALGQSASVRVVASGSNLAYQWFKDGVKLVNRTNNSLNFASFQFTNSGSYSVVVSNPSGLAISLPALLTVPNAPLKAWGYNLDGQLGNGTTMNTSLPVSVANNVVAVEAGGNHSLFVESDGTLWGMGYNGYGELANGTILRTNRPVSVTGNVVAVAAGGNHSLFLDSDGALWAMGYNYSGQLGNGTNDTLEHSVPLTVASNVVAVAAGSAHSLFVTSDGTLWGTGYNGDGELGNGTTHNTNRPVSVASNVVAVAAGKYHSLFVKSDGTLWTMGFNGYGQLGNGTALSTNRPVSVASNVVAVAGGMWHSLFVTSDGTLWTIGHNGYGELGNGSTISTNRPVNVASNVVAVAAGARHSLFATSDGTLWAMGYNSYGELGNGTTNNTNLPIQVPSVTVASLGASDNALHSLAVGFSPLQISGPTNQVVVLGQSASLTVAVTKGDGPFTYQWQLNATNLLNATNASYNFNSVAYGDLGTYSVGVTGVGNSVTSTASLTVNVVRATIGFGDISRDNSGMQFTLQFTGSVYYPYILQSATNLVPPVNWQPVVTNVADASGVWQFTETNVNNPQEFYRVISE